MIRPYLIVECSDCGTEMEVKEIKSVNGDAVVHVPACSVCIAREVKTVTEEKDREISRLEDEFNAANKG
jgi:hypothetical protein